MPLLYRLLVRYQKKFENGEVILNTGLVLGYEKLGKGADGKPQYGIKEDEAEIIRFIYREYVKGMPIPEICRALENQGVVTKRGRTKWYPTSVRSILTNERYTGNAVLGKTYKPDVLSKKRYKNDGEKAYGVDFEHFYEMMMEMSKKEAETVTMRICTSGMFDTMRKHWPTRKS